MLPFSRKHCSVPYKHEDKIKQTKTDRQGILKPAQTNEWATPLVTVLKPGGAMHVYADYAEGPHMKGLSLPMTYPEELHDLPASAQHA